MNVEEEVGVVLHVAVNHDEREVVDGLVQVDSQLDQTVLAFAVASLGITMLLLLHSLVASTVPRFVVGIGERLPKLEVQEVD